MPFCPRCGEGNPDRARFCLACGTALAEAEVAATETRKVVTILFTDVTGSTSLGERLDPESLRGVMGRYFNLARGVVERHGGTVEKFIGDAVMVVFGVPQVHEDDALRAVRAAVELADELAALNDELERTYDVRLELRTGVYTGEVAVGAGEVFATGDAVNVAARLEQGAAPGEILIGEPTRRLLGGAVAVEALAPLDLKGKASPVRAWRVLELVGDAAAVRPDAPLVGRERELELLRSAYERAAHGCQLVTVVGPAGIGKSRLVRELVSDVEREATVLQGRCLPYGEGITYWPVADIVRAAAGIDGTVSAAEARRRLAELPGADEDADVIAERIAGAIGLGESGAPSEEIFWAVRRLIEALAADGPLVLVFDDVHWAAPTFLELVEHLASHLPGTSVLLLCTARPELLETRAAWATRTENAVLAVLEPLDEVESSRLIESLGGALDDALERRIVAASGGNPLFVEALRAMLLETDGGNSDVAVPPTIQALLAARLDQLEPAERDVMRRASVIGEEFARPAATDLAGRPSIDAELAALVRKDLLRKAAGDDFGFRHLLVRDAAYASLPRGLRADLHERLARYLEQRAGERQREIEEIIGYHLEQACDNRGALGPPDDHTRRLAAEAGRRLAAGGMRAGARGDNPAAASLLERALALAPADAPEAAELRLFLGTTLMELGQLERAASELAAAEEDARRLGNRRAELATGVTRTVLEMFSNPAVDLAGAAASVEAAIPELERLEADAALSVVWKVLFIIYMIWHDVARAEEAANNALEYARRAGQVRWEGEAQWFVALSLLVGPLPCREALRRCEALLGEAPGPLSSASVLTIVAALRALLGDTDEGRRLVRQAREGYRELGFVLYAENMGQVEAQIEAHAGDIEAAERVLEVSTAALEAIGEFATLGIHLGLRAWMLARLGRAEEALAVSEAAERIAISRSAQAHFRRGRSLALARLGRHAEALAIAREAVGVLGSTADLHGRAETHENLAEVAAAAGEQAEAAEALERAASLYEQKGCVVCSARVRDRLAAAVA